jgi:hypothetical protein
MQSSKKYDRSILIQILTFSHFVREIAEVLNKNKGKPLTYSLHYKAFFLLNSLSRTNHRSKSLIR